MIITINHSPTFSNHPQKKLQTPSLDKDSQYFASASQKNAMQTYKTQTVAIGFENEQENPIAKEERRIEKEKAFIQKMFYRFKPFLKGLTRKDIRRALIEFAEPEPQKNHILRFADSAMGNDIKKLNEAIEQTITLLENTDHTPNSLAYYKQWATTVRKKYKETRETRETRETEEARETREAREARETKNFMDTLTIVHIIENYLTKTIDLKGGTILDKNYYKKAIDRLCDKYNIEIPELLLQLQQVKFLRNELINTILRQDLITKHKKQTPILYEHLEKLTPKIYERIITDIAMKAGRENIKIYEALSNGVIDNYKLQRRLFNDYFSRRSREQIVTAVRKHHMEKTYNQDDRSYYSHLTYDEYNQGLQLFAKIYSRAKGEEAVTQAATDIITNYRNPGFLLAFNALMQEIGLTGSEQLLKVAKNVGIVIEDEEDEDEDEMEDHNYSKEKTDPYTSFEDMVQQQQSFKDTIHEKQPTSIKGTTHKKQPISIKDTMQKQEESFKSITLMHQYFINALKVDTSGNRILSTKERQQFTKDHYTDALKTLLNQERNQSPEMIDVIMSNTFRSVDHYEEYNLLLKEIYEKDLEQNSNAFFEAYSNYLNERYREKPQKLREQYKKTLEYLAAAHKLPVIETIKTILDTNNRSITFEDVVNEGRIDTLMRNQGGIIQNSQKINESDFKEIISSRSGPLFTHLDASHYRTALTSLARRNGATVEATLKAINKNQHQRLFGGFSVSKTMLARELLFEYYKNADITTLLDALYEYRDYVYGGWSGEYDEMQSKRVINEYLQQQTPPANLYDWDEQAIRHTIYMITNFEALNKFLKAVSTVHAEGGGGGG